MAQMLGHVLGGTHHFKTGTTLAINGIRPLYFSFFDFFASIRDIVGGRSAAYEKEQRKAKGIALSEMPDQAKNLGANAIIGIDIDYETIGTNSSMLMVSANGTAVVVE